MVNKNGTGPNKGSQGARDGRGQGIGQGRNRSSTSKGIGKKTGGNKGNC